MNGQLEDRPKNGLNGALNGISPPPAGRFAVPSSADTESGRRMLLECHDGSTWPGYSFGAERSVAGELVFQTGMVGYPESLTDPSYRGQILVITYPLVGNYGVPSRDTRDPLIDRIPEHFESDEEIHVAGLIVATYAGEEYSHYLATSSLGTWLKEQGVPAMFGVDTRALTKKIRTDGSMLCKLLLEQHKTDALLGGAANGNTRTAASPQFESVAWHDPNKTNLVAQVSCREPYVCSPPPALALKHPSGRNVRVLCVDVGLKYNQLRCLVGRGVEVQVVPWDYDFPRLAGSDYDGLFISNGPADPQLLDATTVRHIREALDAARTPVFGICLGHQLIARAAGADTVKLKFGHRGQNIPCTSLISGRCYITTKNHGYAVDATNLPAGWEELFTNANDFTNAGIRRIDRPVFSVQFHPEARPGPRDTEFLFDVFIGAIQQCIKDPKALSAPVMFPDGTQAENVKLNPRIAVKKALLVGSGGLKVGEAGEFDYSGSQALKALKEVGIYTILLNPNIATVQTSKGMADKVYFLPVTADSVRKVIKYERPDAILVTFGGQTALSVGIELQDEFEDLGVRVLGTPISSIIETEDREAFARKMESIGEKCAKSASANTIEEAMSAVESIGFPVIVRAAYALGGLGSGFAENPAQLKDICGKAFAYSPQVLIERSMKGWLEVEWEIMRDSRDNCIAICNMENFDPLGIHTGDSIVVTPSQTLSDDDYHSLRTTAISIMRSLKICGEGNVQLAVNPDNTKEYCIIEVNARLSRSSALASKATGYPIAYVAAKLGLGIPLNEILNRVTKKTCAAFEPSLDYVVCKMARFDLKKFHRVSTALGSSMKSVGEVMSIGRTFEEAVQKAIRSVEFHNLGFSKTNTDMSLEDELQTPSDQRMFALANAMAAGYSVDKIWELTKINRFFLMRLKGLSDFAEYMSTFRAMDVPVHLIRRAKQLGFSDLQLAEFWGSTELAVRRLRVEAGIVPHVKQVDTVAAEFPAMTNYLYITANAVENDVDFQERHTVIIGSGPYRIGSSVEYDASSWSAAQHLRQFGRKTILVNCNPETVSTDYDSADRLYFETINLETVLDIHEAEASEGIVLSMGGQAPNNLALPLDRLGVRILGTSATMIDTAENRFKFARLLDRINVDQPVWARLTSFEEAADFASRVEYPVLVRPSYVLSGAAMNTCWSREDLKGYLAQAEEVSREHPVVITKYYEGCKEIEVDAVACDGQIIVQFVSEHVENAGVHSGDATIILPPQDLEPETIRRIEEATAKIAQELNISGPLNAQFLCRNNGQELMVIETNVRASRSFPFVSKVQGLDLIELATKVMIGAPVQQYPRASSLNYVGVKVPQFSFSRLSGADPVLGVEMASTGEVACFGRDKYEAYLKALLSTGFRLPKKNILLSIGSFKEKMEMLPSIQKLHSMGYRIFATAGTADFLQEHGLPVQYLEDLSSQAKDQKSEYSLTSHLANNLLDLYICLPSNNRYRRPANYLSTGYVTRRMAVDYAVPLVTNVKTAKILIEAMSRQYKLDVSPIDCQTSHQTVTLPGLINIGAFVPGLVSRESHDLENVTKASIAAGFTMIRVIPLGVDGSLTDGLALQVAQSNSQRGVHCDFNFSVAATPTNSEEVAQVSGQVGSLFIPFNHLSGNIGEVDAAAAHFDQWPKFKPIITDAKTTSLAALLLLASLHARKLHVSSVTTKEDIRLIALCKKQGLAITCDVSVYALFFSQAEYPECKFLPTASDQQALWEHLNTIDVFSVGSIPYQLAVASGQSVTPEVGIADTVPLLFTAVSEGRLTLKDIVERMHDNPKHIFDLHDQDATSVEITVDRPYLVQPSSAWSPLAGRTMRGDVSRVLFGGSTVCLESELLAGAPRGQDMSSHMPAAPMEEARGAPSPALPPQAENLVDGDLVHSAARAPGTQLPPLIPAAIHAPAMVSIPTDSAFKRAHIASVRQFTRADLHQLFTLAADMRLGVERYGVLDVLRGKVLGMVFYEPSTRTSLSFDAAMQRLGGRTINFAESNSSSKKGESLADTIRTVGCYADAIVLRHPDPESMATASKCSPVPIINAGNGAEEHPTQAFLDMYTIREVKGTINKLHITFVGDLRYGRTVHSLLQLLAHYSVSVRLVAPQKLQLPEKLRMELQRRGQLEAEDTQLTDDILAKTDVLYCTRVQKERFASEEEYERVKDGVRVNNRTLRRAKTSVIVMHPLPRNRELDEEVDFDQRAVYFEQMKYGMYCRMALLALVMAP